MGVSSVKIMLLSVVVVVVVCIYYLEGTDSKITVFVCFQEHHRNSEKLRVYMVWGEIEAVTKLQMFVWIFKHVLRVIT